ncbi:hypothetical protein HUJ05_012366 [Dendroctonus ponderosae]|nr:hypothetical protein HUJ05_012366 [Dendroctonus ponderosae]
MQATRACETSRRNSTERRPRNPKNPLGVNCFCFGPSTKLLIVGSESGSLQLWNTFISKTIATFSASSAGIVDVQIIDSHDLFLSCSSDGVLKLWCLREYTCLQTIKLKFPCFRIDGKTIEWSNGCLNPGPKRKQPHTAQVSETEQETFGISDVDEKQFLDQKAKTRPLTDLWERSSVLVTCCNYMAFLRANFANASIEDGFTCPIVPPPPLQNSVLIPANWRFKSETTPCEGSKGNGWDFKKQLENLSFILDKNLLEEAGARSDINYKIAALESQKEKMRSKVALGSPYLALDLPEIQPLELTPDVSLENGTKRQKYAGKIENLLQDAARRDHIFSSSASSAALSRSSRSSVVEIPY